MEREPGQELIVEPAEEEAEPLVEVATEDEPAGGEAEAPEPDEPATVEVSLVAEKLSPDVQFGWSEFPGISRRATAACRSNPEQYGLTGNPAVRATPSRPLIGEPR